MQSLDELARKHRTDKGPAGARGLTAKHYTHAYARYLEPIRLQKLNLLEIGVDTGASLRMWRDYLPHATIHGIDIKGQCRRHAGDRIKVYIGSQTDDEFLQDVVLQLDGPLHAVVDDGGHKMSQHAASLVSLFPHLISGGFYAIEDLHTAYNPRHGGGGADSTVEKLKGFVDAVNGHGSFIVDDVESIHFYRSIAFLLKTSA